MDVEIATLASPSYIEQYGSPKHPRDLTQHRCLIGSITRWSFQSIQDSQEHYDVTIEGQLVSRNGHAMINSAAWWQWHYSYPYYVL